MIRTGWPGNFLFILLMQSCTLCCQKDAGNDRGGVMDGVLSDIERFARERPGAPCLSEGAWHLDYAAVAAISDRMAGALLDRIGRPGGSVAWIGSAGAARVLAYLATQKAGQVFSAPTLSLTTDQIRGLLRLSKFDLILLEDGYRDAAARFADGPFLAADFDTAPASPFRRPALGQGAPSHVSVTSGSTGMPKALIRPRGALEHFVRMACRMQGLGPGDRTALLGNLWNPTQFTGLSAGAHTACFDVPRLGAGDLARWMRDEAVTTVMIYPAIFRELMAACRPLPDLRCIILIGEALTRADAEAHARVCAPEAELINVYGSMEFPYLTAWRRRAGDPVDFEIMPMGREVLPGEMRLIDGNGDPVEDGATGEIQITSHHLPDGYLGNPGLNAERYGRLPDGRLTLRTGDLAYRDHAGIYHSAGRRDQQIKIRGYNVRPPDIEPVIREQEGVDEAVVVVRTLAGGAARLVCYYTGAAEAAALRAGLTDRLPAYMIPALWQRMAALPKTHSGKVIRGDLPDPGGARAAVPGRFRSGTEQVLARLFARILETSAFGRDDDFFDLGGDSLQAMRLVIEAEAAFGRRLPFESLILEGASIAALAEGYDRAAQDAASVLRPGRGGRTLIVTHTKGGHLSDHLEYAQRLDPAFRVVGARGSGMSGGPGQARMADMAAHALKVLQGETGTGGPPVVIGYSFGVPIAVELARAIAGRDGRAPPLILLDPLTPWRDGRRWLRPIRDAVRDGEMRRAVQLARRNAGAVLGIVPRDEIEAHTLAWLRYRPAALRADDVLIVGAADADAAVIAAWRAVFDPEPQVLRATGDHLTMMRGDNTGPLAQTLQKWIARLG